MKLHLPVRLFHTVIALMAATVPFPAFAAPKYTVADGSQLTLSELTKLSISGYSASAYGAYENINHNGYLGGAIYARGTASVYIINNSVDLLSDNYAKNSDSKSSRGGAIYAYSGDVVLNKNNSITFSNNYATYYTSGSYGGAIYCYQGAISLIENDTVSFSSNYASARTGASYGGAIYSNEGSITLSKNKSLYFSENYTEDYVYSSSYGGAIYSEIGAITLSENEKVVFSKNHAEAYSSYGGAICSNRAAVTLIENTNLIFSENYVLSSAYQAAYGGAIYSNSGAISLRRNENITFSKNYASASETASSSYTNIYSYGGALYNNSGNTILNENESITFSSNSSSASISATSSIATTSAYSYGGALYSSSGLISLSTNENTSFIGNHTSTTATSSSSSSSYNPANVNSYSYGGVIYSNSGAISLSQTDNIIFSSNYVSSISTTDKSSAYSYSRGGAIYDNSNVITLSENTTITFSGNYATATSTATTTANAFSYGGAIYGKTSIVNNGSVIFRDNSVRSQSIGAKTALGGAIYGSSINIRNNKTVVFEGNYEKSGSSSYTYCLRCLYATGSVNLSANADNSVKFRDSLYTGADLILNEQYGDIAQTGDIIFSGEYTKKHLSELKSNYSATELQNSLTSIVKGKTTLYDGRLIIREGAILQGTGIDINTSVSGKYVTTVLLQNGYLNQGDYDISFATGTVLEAGGINEMTGNRWTMANGSSITLHAAAENANTAVLSYNGHFFMGESLTLNISFNPEEAKNGTYKLLNVTSFVDESNWTAENVTITGLNGLEISFEDLYWDDEILYFNYLSDNSAGPGTGGNGGSGTEPGGSDVTPYFFVGTWTNESGNGLWDNSSLNWEQNELDYAYSDGADVLFGDAGAGTVTLVVDLAPSSVLVNSTKDYTWVADEDFGGSLTGVMVLTKQGEGTLTICTDNSYMGGTNIEGGKLSVQHVNALGKGDISLSAGTLEMNGYAVQNNITASGGTLSGATNYGGSLQIAGDVALNGQVKATNGIQLLSGSVSGGSIADTKVVATGDSSVEIATSLSGTTSLSATGTSSTTVMMMWLLPLS